LKKENTVEYTGYAFCATSTTILANSSAFLKNLKHYGSWKSTTVAEGYIQESIQQKTDITVSLTNPSNSTTITTTISASSLVFQNCVLHSAIFNGVLMYFLFFLFCQ
jgi:hypothetical protein